MSTFAVKVIRIDGIEPIAGADNIECAVIGDYRSVVLKGQFAVGQLAAYIPEGAVLPRNVLRALNMWDNEKQIGRLAGSAGDRVKAIKLRGQLSQGLLYPVDSGKDVGHPFINVLDDLDNIGSMVLVQEGDDLASELGIVKYEPPVPVHLSGDVYAAGTALTVGYDIENFKAYPDVLVEGEEVVMTSKLHGTFCGVGILPPADQDDRHYQRKFVVFSKGLGAQGLCFKDSERSLNTVYFRALLQDQVFERLERAVDLYADVNTLDTPLFVLGEVFGKGVQDLEYGMNGIAFRAFDVCFGYRGNQRYFGRDMFHSFTDSLGIERVPEVYVGPFNKQVMAEHTGGKENVSGKGLHVNEGVVIKPVEERYDSNLGRVILKSVSEQYLLRKGKATEFN